MLSVRLPDVPPEAFQLVLTYIYTDCIDPTDGDVNHKREPGSNQIVLLMMQVRRVFNMQRLSVTFSPMKQITAIILVLPELPTTNRLGIHRRLSPQLKKDGGHWVKFVVGHIGTRKHRKYCSPFKITQNLSF